MAARYIERVVPTLLLFLAFSNTFARAGGDATREIIGFSPDGRYFAFEQYGVQDGSGYPYSEIFVIDAAEDKWVAETPIRKRIDDEKVKPRKVREAARAEAEPILTKLNISEPGEHLFSRPRAEFGLPNLATVNIAHRSVPPAEQLVTFSLAEKPLTSAECAKYSDRPMQGFSLHMRLGPPILDPKEQQFRWDHLILHDDETLPESRGCALGYQIADVLSFEAGSKVTYVVLLHVQTVGFEGPDSRFLAVTRICRRADCELRKSL